MSDKELVTINPEQWERLLTDLVTLTNAGWGIRDELRPLDNAIDNHAIEVTKWLGSINDTLGAGLAEVARAIREQQPPPPPAKPKGVIMATFKVGADNPDIQIALTGSGFMDSDTPPNPVGAGDIDLSVESSNPDAVSAALSGQTLSDDGNSVSATVDVHFGAPASDIATLTYRATNRDTGLVVAAGTDDFIVQVGEAGIGTITSSVPLTAEP